MADVSLLPLLSHRDPAAPFAYRPGSIQLPGNMQRPENMQRERCVISVADFLADVAALAAQLPAGRHLLNLCSDRYRFTVGLAAAMSTGKISLLPSTHTPESLRQMRAFAPDVFCLREAAEQDDTLPTLVFPELHGAAAGAPALPVPAFPAGQTVAYVFTSGSTGVPLPHAKHWGALVSCVRAGAQRFGLLDGRAYTLVGTVPPQHMYGFESTVLLALQSGAALWAGKPFYAADIAAALAAVPAPRLLVSTPFHLRAFIEEYGAESASSACPPLHATLSATAPLSQELAASVESFSAAPLLEIYGCTESGQLATRRPTQGSEWRLLDDVRMLQQGETTLVEGGHIEGCIPLGDIIEITAADRFVLHGRNGDLINIAGKRTSLGFLNHQLAAITGVRDGVFLLPDADADAGADTRASEKVQRLAALVVAPGISADAILQALRERIDPVFLPRPLLLTERLPRNAAGKLPRRELLALLQRLRTETERGGA